MNQSIDNTLFLNFKELYLFLLYHFLFKDRIKQEEQTSKNLQQYYSALITPCFSILSLILALTLENKWTAGVDQGCEHYEFISTKNFYVVMFWTVNLLVTTISYVHFIWKKKTVWELRPLLGEVIVKVDWSVARAPISWLLQWKLCPILQLDSLNWSTHSIKHSYCRLYDWEWCSHCPVS